MIYPKEKIKTGTWFIDLNQSFDEVELISAGENPKNNYILSVIWQNFPEEPTVIELEHFNGRIFPDLNGPWTELPDEYVMLREKFNDHKKDFILKIYHSPLKKILLDEAIHYYRESCDLEEEIAEAFIKLQIAKGDIRFEKQKGGDFINLSRLYIDAEDKKRFLHSIADEIISQSNRVELLIKHVQTKGNFREYLFRKVLEKYIPNQYQVATGFIEGCKRQCDILIYDASNYSPLFIEGDLVVVPLEAVRAIIEVKTTLGSAELKEALDLLSEVARNANRPTPIFKGIFAFKKGYQSEKAISKAISNFYHQTIIESAPPITNDVSYLYETINAVCVLNEQAILCDLFDFAFADDTIRPRLYSVHSNNPELKIHSVSFLAELFSFLNVRKSAKKVNINYFDILNYEMYYQLEKELYDKNWKPNASFRNEHNFEFQGIWDRVTDVINWKMGNYDSEELDKKYFPNKYQVQEFQGRFKKQSNE